MKKKIILFLTIGMTMLLLSACASKEAKNVIEQIDEIGKISVESGDKLNKIKNEYETLSDEDKADIKNYSKYEEALKKYNSAIYKEIKKELEVATEAEKNYFAQYYDLEKFSAAKADAQKAIDNSDSEKYSEVYKTLKEENIDISSFIEEEGKKIYNVPTSENPNEEFPFAVNPENVVPPIQGEPLIKQNSKHPTWIIFSEPNTTDEKPYANLFIDDSSNQYDYNIQNVETTEIKVQDENKEIQTALVNSQINFRSQEGYQVDANTKLNERPAYILVDQNEQIVLALKSYDGGEYYILYPLYEY